MCPMNTWICVDSCVLKCMCVFSYLRWLITGLVNLFFTLILSPHRFWGQAKRIFMSRKVILASFQLKKMDIDRKTLEMTLQLAV